MKLSDYVEFNPKTPLQRGVETPFVDMNAIVPGLRRVTANERRVAISSGSRFKHGDTLFARITPCLENGKIAQYSGDEAAMGSTEFIVLRARPGVADQDYLYYFTLQRALRSAAEKSMVGASGRQRVDIRSLTEFECQFPSQSEQRRIASFLSSYDDLIENNLRRMKLLEHMASDIFRNWFLEYRFPGHETRMFVTSGLGSVPQGWGVTSVINCIEINPRIVLPRVGSRPFVPMSGLSNDSMLISDVGDRDGSTGPKIQNGDTLFARITPCLENGKTGFVQFLPDSQTVARGSTEFIVLRSKSLTPEFVYLLARSDGFRSNAIKSMTGASGRQRVQEQCFARFFIPHPPQKLLDRFSAIVAPSFRLIHVLHLAVENLRRTRDLLLPRLMSASNHSRRIAV